MMAIEGRRRKLWSLAVLGVTISLLILQTTSTAIEDDAGATSLSGDDESHQVEGNTSSERYKIISFNFQHVEVPYVICLWILLASVAKIGFHLYDKLPDIFPESCLLIILGILVGVTLYFTETASSQQYSLDANIFFLFLLPPIIYDAGYHMPNRAFFNNMGTILLLAVVNTLWNTFGIGLGIWSMSYLGWIDQKIGIFNCFVFSALISAVDPVAVLAIFEEIKVNEILYILVFGEALLNDGVTVVLYRMMEGFTAIGTSNIKLVDFVAGFAQFFIVVIGGTLIGVMYGFMGAFITKYTNHVRVIEPLFIFVLGYLAYLTAEVMGLSSILALTFGGIIMRHYSEANMTKKSTTTVKYFMKMLATISETIIFMFLGLSTVIDSHEFHLDFILFSILFCLIFRVTGVVLLSFIVNQRRLIRLTAVDQFIMCYGGLRGGIAFCLALLLNKHHIPEKAMFVTTTTVIVFFTVFIQGITIKPVVNALKAERKEDKDSSMNEMIHKRFIDHLMAGVEDIVGKSGHNSFQHKFDYYNTKYLKPLLLREKPKGHNPSIVRTITKLSMQDAKAAVLFPRGISRNHSFSQLISCSPTTANLFSRRATIAVPGGRNRETIVNLISTDPVMSLGQDKKLAMRHILGDSLFEPRHTWVRERRHTFANAHSRPPFHHCELKHLASNTHTTKVEGIETKVYSAAEANMNISTDTSGKQLHQNTNFLDQPQPINHHLPDVTEIVTVQESPCQPLESEAFQSMLPVSMPAPLVIPNEEDVKSQFSTSAPLSSIIAPSDLEVPTLSKLLQGPSSPCLASIYSTSSSTDATKFAGIYNVASKSFLDLLYTEDVNINIPTSQTKPRGNDCWSYSDADDDVFKEDQIDTSDNEPIREGTLAETTLPWRRHTSLPPVPSSLSLSLPDDENPLMSEAPSWADNLAYSHLTETGSPYQSPQNTITAKPAVAQPRAVFDIFPPLSPQHSSSAISSSIPPPWSFKDNNANTVVDEPLPSHSVAGQNSGDKASCLLVSSHDLVPPSYHSCLQPTTRGPEISISRRHSEVSSPTHFQFMEKPESISAANLESQLIGIEEDYHHGMKERVSQWLANSDHGDEDPEDHDYVLTGKEEGEKILESLHQKKLEWSMGDGDDGTDGDVESDEDTRL